MSATIYAPDGSPMQQWDDTTRTHTDYTTTPPTVRPYTAAENAAADAAVAQATLAANAAALAADTTADLTKLRESIDALALLLADESTVGSIRNIMGPSGATAGTSSLRALKAQNNTAVVSAASVKALIDASIALAQLSINDAQAGRRIARQTLRLARHMVGDFSSTDVGAP